jgi:hypothetical protein
MSVLVDWCMQDLEIARKRLFSRGLRLSIVKDGRIVYESGSHGVSGFLDAIDREGTVLDGASVADRVVGKVIALLCVYAKVKAVYAVTLSKGAEVVLEQHLIHHEWGEIVDSILDIDRASVCPFEKLVSGVSSPRAAYERLKAFCGRF